MAEQKNGKFVWGNDSKLSQEQEIGLCLKIRENMNVVLEAADRINKLTDEESKTNPLVLMILETAYESKTAAKLLLENLTAE